MNIEYKFRQQILSNFWIRRLKMKWLHGRKGKMNAVSLENKTILVTGECEIIRGCHNRDKGTAENERLRTPKFIFSYPKNERLIFLCSRNAAQEEISTMRVGWQPADRQASLSALCVGRDIDEEIEWDCGKDLWVKNLRLQCSDRSDYREKAE